MTRLNLSFAIDVSGIPPEETIFSCVSFNMDYYSSLIKYFKNDFKKCFHKKGKHLDESTLSEILKFLDKNKVRSYSTIYSPNNWNYAFSLVPKYRAYKREKICGIIYYNLLQINSFPQQIYPVSVCKESFMKIDKVISSCLKIAKMRHMDYEITTGSDKYSNQIKFADYIAAATKKIKMGKLKKFQYYNLIKVNLSKGYISKVFEKK